MIFKLFTLSLLLFCSPCFAGAEAIDTTPLSRLSELAKKSLAEKINSAEIVFPSIEKLSSNAIFNEITAIKSVRLIEEKNNGVAMFEVIATGDQTGGRTGEKTELITKIIHLPFEAWVKVPVATRRIYPNTKLKADDFKIQSINVATGMAREYRGILASPQTSFVGIQSKQTILEGGFLTTAAIQRAPDVKRGETVRLELISGELSLTTQGVAQEQASIGDRVRVLSAKTKKEVTGIVREDHSVEVTL